MYETTTGLRFNGGGETDAVDVEARNGSYLQHETEKRLPDNSDSMCSIGCDVECVGGVQCAEIIAASSELTGQGRKRRGSRAMAEGQCQACSAVAGKRMVDSRNSLFGNGSIQVVGKYI